MLDYHSVVEQHREQNLNEKSLIPKQQIETCGIQIENEEEVVKSDEDSLVEIEDSIAKFVHQEPIFVVSDEEDYELFQGEELAHISTFSGKIIDTRKTMLGFTFDGVMSALFLVFVGNGLFGLISVIHVCTSYPFINTHSLRKLTTWENMPQHALMSLVNTAAILFLIVLSFVTAMIQKPFMSTLTSIFSLICFSLALSVVVYSIQQETVNFFMVCMNGFFIINCLLFLVGAFLHHQHNTLLKMSL